MGEWAKRFWGDLTTLEYGKALRGYQDAAGPVRVYGTNGPVGWHDVAQSKGAGVIVGRKGAYRGVHYSEGPFWVIDTAYYLRPRVPLDLRWAYYSLKSMDINSMDSGSAIPSTSRTDFYSLPVVEPPLDEQKAIAAVLGALDDKIDINKRVCETVNELMDSCYSESIEQGAVTKPLVEVAKFHNRSREPLSSRQRAEFQGPYPYYGATGIIDRVAEYRFDGDYVLVGEDGTVVTGDGHPVVQSVLGKFWVSNHAHVLTGSRTSNEILRIALRRADVRSLITGAVQPKLSMGNLKTLNLEFPLQSQERCLDEKLSSLAKYVRDRTLESGVLGELRDALLPKLMSGELRVKDAERAVEEAL